MGADSTDGLLATVADGLGSGALIPYLGAEAVLLAPANAALPLAPEALAAFLSKRATVPSRIRRNPTATAQYIENFRHRKTLRKLMLEAFATPAEVPAFYRLLARLAPPMVVDTGYDTALAGAFAGNSDWAQIQGVSRAEVREGWYLCYDAAGAPPPRGRGGGLRTLVYKPLGGVQPAGNFIISDSDFVEVLTEIDIQTPIPEAVKSRRASRGFVFFGCRFRDQLTRTYARQVMKRSAGPHFAVLPAAELTRNELRFIAEQGITVIDRPLAEVAAALEAALDCAVA
ncbi:LOW QUALITY PROTEIN: hypothetical protein Dsui_0947 [Azospira oryzae PS]|uniref:Uncharacterized protein n=1 Tax=Azospira oryzae (strain ATCC BAA-33 / DSM 13638 / PS) TaxID=640081 RepID=G8QIY4_AZOOP|nr:LOW QUALITY PROTEIN: hypothetical protein Dsui_0947 [Azospira oryzae PS]